MNKCLFIGRTTKDIEVKNTATGKEVANFTLAVRREVQVESQPEADFLNFTIWGKPAENMAKLVHKGEQVGIEARVQTRNYDDKDGKRVYVTEFIVDRFTLIGNGKREDTGDTAPVDAPAQADPMMDASVMDDALPWE